MKLATVLRFLEIVFKRTFVKVTYHIDIASTDQFVRLVGISLATGAKIKNKSIAQVLSAPRFLCIAVVPPTCGIAHNMFIDLLRKSDLPYSS